MGELHGRPSGLRRLRETLSLVGLFANPSKRRARAVYDLLSTHNNLAEHSLYLNLGYWTTADTYDDACAAMATELARTAGLGPGQRVLDVGFGFGDQDLAWAEQLSPACIVGVNVTPAQVALARRRVAERGLGKRVALALGSATALPCAPASFDAVVALECAFHFVTREQFFAEAFRVLRPGGRLALADLVPMPGRLRGPWDRLADAFGRSFWQMPAENMVEWDTYRAQLEAAGFAGIEARSVRAQVFPGFARYARRRLADPEIRARVHPWVRALWRAGLKEHISNTGLDYLLVRAVRPSL